MLHGALLKTSRNAFALGLCLFTAGASWVGLRPPVQRAELRVPFVENAGQIANPEVAYYASTFHGGVYVDRGGEILYLL